MDIDAGDFRLWEGSPCIDAGTNHLGVVATNSWTGEPVPYAYSPTDILGNTRFVDGNGDGKVAWDTGAYEFNSLQAFRFAGPPIVTVSEDPDCGLVRNVRLTITGALNTRARVQKSSDLRGWKVIWSGAVGGDGVAQVDDRQGECVDEEHWEGMMFYRVVVP